MPIPDRRIFHPNDMHHRGIWGIRPSFPGLSPCPGQVAYVLLTSAPVAARSIATPALPLDLHVLSLSLAFILSQDQTLRCCIIVLFLTKRYYENATAMWSGARPAHPASGWTRICCARVSTCLRNLDGSDPAVSLPCLCTVNFPHCKHFNDLPDRLSLRRQKNRSRNFHLVSRKSVAKLLPLIELTKKNRNFFQKKSAVFL